MGLLEPCSKPSRHAAVEAPQRRASTPSAGTPVRMGGRVGTRGGAAGGVGGGGAAWAWGKLCVVGVGEAARASAPQGCGAGTLWAGRVCVGRRRRGFASPLLQGSLAGSWGP